MEVLRSVSLPSDLNEVLRVLAFHKHITISELIIQMLRQGVEDNRELLETWAPGLLPNKE